LFRNNKGIYVSMVDYTNKFISFMGVDQSGVKNRQVLYPYNAALDAPEEPLDKQGSKNFLTGLGMVGWLVSCFRADLAYSYSMIAQNMSQPTVKAYEQLRWVARYLKGTTSLSAFSPSSLSVDVEWRFFTDSDQGGDRSQGNKGRSRSGAIATANGFPVMYKSKTTSVAMAHPSIPPEGHADVSSAACEIYAAANATFEFLHLSYIVDEMGKPFPTPIPLEMDNTAAEIFCNNTAANSKLRHIDQRQHWISTLRDHNVVIPVHVSSAENVADLFTKPLTGDTFIRLRNTFLVER